MTAGPKVGQTGQEVPPFPGLRSFSSQDHRYFFGREKQKYALYLLLKRFHFISVVGSSGSGKSSIVRAGLLPMMNDENAQTGGATWRYATMRPGRAPIERLARALAKVVAPEDQPLFVVKRDRIAAILRASRDGIREALAEIAAEDAEQFVLVVDQFEELFRYSSMGAQIDRVGFAKRREEATNFVQLLLEATRSYESRIRVIITMRSDFIGDCANFRGLPEAVTTAQFLVPSLTRDQREEAIRSPIELSGASIDSTLVERLLNDSSDELDQLPVLQHCLARLWMRARGKEVTPEAAAQESDVARPTRHLTETDYLAIGGLTDALSGHADEIVASLPGKEDVVEKVFRSLAEIDKDSRAIRRPRELAQLVAETGASRDDVCAVLDKFRADECSFIVPPLSMSPSSDLPDETIIDVGHEALLRRWKLVSGDPGATDERGDKRDIGWLRQEQKDGELYQFLRSCVDPESSNSPLLSGDQVKRYNDWWVRRKPNRDWANRYGGSFEEVGRLLSESRLESRRSSRKRWALIVFIGLVVVTSLAVESLLWIRQQQAQAQLERTMDAAMAFSDGILSQFNAGNITTIGADELQKVAANVYRNAGSAVTDALRAGWLITQFDIDEALGEKNDKMRAKAVRAQDIARIYLNQNSADRGWKRLLYASLFRLGDFDLDQYEKRRDNPGLLKQATAEYDEARMIAEQLVSEQPVPTKTELAAADPTPNQKFDLAFVINKVGEAMESGGDYDGALKKFREALAIASQIEDSQRVENKLQSATTKIKIANTLIELPQPDFNNALQTYGEAIERVKIVYGADQSNHIAQSNLADAYEQRAQALVSHGDFNQAFDDYKAAIDLLEHLANKDARDTKWIERLARIHARFGLALENEARAANRPIGGAAVEQYKGEVEARKKLAERDPDDDKKKSDLRDSTIRWQRAAAAAKSRDGK